ncbi:MAG TPA: glycosyltransferase [Candidatus Paceibacterota bacterium]
MNPTVKRNAIILAINDLDFGGGQRTVVAEANELHTRGIPVHIVTTLAGARMPLRALLRIPESQIHHAPFKSLADFSAYSTLFQLIRSINPYAIVSNLFFTNTVVRIAAFFSSVRITVREGNVPTEKGIFAKIVDLILSLRTHSIITNSARVKNSLPFVFAKKVLLYNGIGDAFFARPPVRESMRQELGVAPDEVLVLSVGSLTEKKGQRYAIEALDQVDEWEEKSPNTHLVFVGDGPRRMSLEDYSRALSLKERMHFLGNRTDIPELLAATDVFILPSLWEGMPNAVLEAMAAGVPVVATDVGGVSEIIKNGENGFLVPTDDASLLSWRMGEILAKVVNDAPLRERIGKNASASVSHLTWEKHVTKLLEIV